MSTATLSQATMSQATLSPRENVRPPRPALPALKGGALAGVSATPDGGWLRGRGVAGSAALHGAALLAAWALSGTSNDPPAPAPVVELIRLQPEALKPPPPPPPEPEKPKQLTAARPAPAPLPVPKTVDAAADKAETFTPPEPPPQATPIGPVAPPVPAPVAEVPAPPAPPPAQAAPKQISTEGIPTDYVNQVYARINGSTEYPREAKMRRQQGKVGYRLTLSPQGALLAVDIQTSGNDVLDEAARDAIRRAAPFPKLPDLGGSSYLLAGNIVFKIN